MSFVSISALAFLSAQAAAPAEGPPAFVTFLPLVLIMVIFYFLILRPQKKKAKQHENTLKTLKPGDKILAGGGLVAVVISVKEKTVSIRCADSKLEILKSAVTEITERGTGSESSAT